MANYYTMRELRARAGGLTAEGARERLRESAKSAVGPFDVFLSHSFQDAQVILGLRGLLSDQGLRVYVDWVDDPELDRSRVSSATAARLRQRMQQSRSLIYATSRAARKSRWMPWELGYFDGIRDGSRVSILPVDGDGLSAFDGEEYLGLYRVIEKVNADDQIRPYVLSHSRRQGESLASFVNGQGRLEDLVKL
ncbi:toll/interleukin-1 receptor domain-containing protein [Nocardiopsis sp. N85]|uniref:toll/interleukin-1 receptor domain-containing protein n=1 Tax=Nocardiopsis sp. N85 TaxID=3029400 RepID=UPI00237FBE0F|nr:toll/interleukin-1 receptor domain-containing protein [Nocardiopsis sp. N85]MDE3721377.1 toll/interleukin-1 receptor domain-containing protein [Nocardiopsis sp. N85]